MMPPKGRFNAWAAPAQTGRYPWGVGFYDMSDDFNHCVDPRFKMLPQLLKEQGYATHAIGKCSCLNCIGLLHNRII